MKNGSNRMFIADVILHASDVSNPTKLFNRFDKWTKMIIEEFCSQGFIIILLLFI
jgi:hypothetical protein